MPKYYIMLVDTARNEMRVPVKALLNPYDDKNAFAAGMPQFFGGTGKGNQRHVDVLAKEVTEESRRTLQLTLASAEAAPELFGRNDMYFYWTRSDGWRETGTPWNDGRGPDEREMDRIAIIDLTPFVEDWSDDAIIAELVRQAGCGDAPVQGKRDFARSETRVAFLKLIRQLVGG